MINRKITTINNPGAVYVDVRVSGTWYLLPLFSITTLRSLSNNPATLSLSSCKCCNIIIYSYTLHNLIYWPRHRKFDSEHEMKIAIHQSVQHQWKYLLFFIATLQQSPVSTPSYKLPITPVSHTNSPVRKGSLIQPRQNTILAKHQQASHHSIISQSINFVTGTCNSFWANRECCSNIIIMQESQSPGGQYFSPVFKGWNNGILQSVIGDKW